jgi:RNA polymerase sigma factor (sigma-70 family)
VGVGGRAVDFESLLERLREDTTDQTAWTSLFRMTWPFVVAICHRSLPAPRRVVDAEDIAQEVFFAFSRYVHERRPNLRSRDDLFAVLAAMSRRLSAQAVRWRSRRRRGLRLEKPGAEMAPDAHGSPDSTVELLDLLDAVSRNLAPDHRRVLNLRLQGYNNSEIAGRLEVSVRTLERWLGRIRDVVGNYFDT